MELKKMTRMSLLLALSVVLSLIESVIPIFNGMIPFLNFGLDNTIILFVLYHGTLKDALYLSLLRVILIGILRTGLFSISFFFSLSGALFSILTMYLAKHFTKLSMVGVSIVGSLFHSIGQILIAIVIVQERAMIAYLPFILMFSIPTGIFVGMISKQLVKRFHFYLNTE